MLRLDFFTEIGFFSFPRPLGNIGISIDIDVGIGIGIGKTLFFFSKF